MTITARGYPCGPEFRRRAARLAQVIAVSLLALAGQPAAALTAAISSKAAVRSACVDPTLTSISSMPASKNLRTVANGPGEVVGPGEFARARDLIARGTKVNYEGASGPIEFNATGDAQGRVEHWMVRNGRVTSVAQLAE